MDGLHRQPQFAARRTLDQFADHAALVVHRHVTAGLAASNGEARRHIQSGAVRVNDAVIEDDKLSIGDNALLPEGVIKLSVGKKRHALIKPV